MGTLLDSIVVLELERELNRLPVAGAMAEMAKRLERGLGADELGGMAPITESELLHAVRRADQAHRARREAFVEAVANVEGGPLLVRPGFRG